ALPISGPGGWHVGGACSVSVGGTITGSSSTSAVAGCSVPRELHLRELNASSPYEFLVSFTDAPDSAVGSVSTGTNYSFTSVTPNGGESVFTVGATSGSGFELDFAANALEPGSAGSLAVSVSDGDATHPPASFTVALNVSTPSLGGLFVSPSPAAAATLLQQGRE